MGGPSKNSPDIHFCETRVVGLPVARTRTAFSFTSARAYHTLHNFFQLTENQETGVAQEPFERTKAASESYRRGVVRRQSMRGRSGQVC